MTTDLSIPTEPPVPVRLSRRGARPPRHLADMSRGERRAAAVAIGHSAFRADQLSRHYFGRLVAPGDPDALTDLPAASRVELAAALLPELLTRAHVSTCDAGGTRKTLWRTVDGAAVESVLMRYPDRATVCVSSQAGCGMGCPFCATGQGGLVRNLTCAEIVEQVVAAARDLAAAMVGGRPGRLTNVVFMGMGEPMANYTAVVGALHRLTDPVPGGLGMSVRGLTVSTVGLVPAMRRLAGEGLPVTLAVSLHAPDDALRDTLVPVNTRWPVAEVLDAAWEYAARTGRRVSIEYALIGGVNDGADRADALADLLSGHLAHVNLIPLNPTAGSAWQASSRAGQRLFLERLRSRGIAATVRDNRGREIAAACGQLAADVKAGVAGPEGAGRRPTDRARAATGPSGSPGSPGPSGTPGEPGSCGDSGGPGSGVR
jgi:23S rRNA (adenine2503-C2)-methyltransferase